MFTAPKKLLVVSDSNEMELRDDIIVKKSGERQLVYVYTKSFTKDGLMLPISENDLRNNLKNNIFKSIE